MKFLHIIGTLDSNYGGPVEALKQLSNELAKFGHSVDVITLDKPDDQRIKNLDAKVYAVGPSIGKYKYNSKLIDWLVKNSKKYDLVTIHGIWQFQSFGTWLAARKAKFTYNIFVHGALDPWFKHEYPLKHLKKWLYWPWAEYRVLRDANSVLFTSEEEERLAEKSFSLYKVKPVVINYGIGSPAGDTETQKRAFFEKYPGLIGKRLVIFIGRIHPKKGCDILIEAFSKIAPLDQNFHLIMAGPDQTGWVPSLKEKSALLNVENRITWTGMITDNLKWGLFHSAEVFVLPSHSENYGVAVVESLACGLPVIITNKVNIWREIKEDHAGLVADDTLEDIARKMKIWLQMDPSNKKIMNENAIQCFKKRFSINRTAEQLIGLAYQNDNKLT